MYNLIKNTLFVVSIHYYFKGDHIMFCKYCGNQIKDGSAFCPGCGKNQGKAAAATPPYTPPQQPIYGTPNHLCMVILSRHTEVPDIIAICHPPDIPIGELSAG